MEKTYTYSRWYRYIYRFANIPATLLGLLYLAPAALTPAPTKLQIAGAAVISLLLIIINLYFRWLWQNVPATISTTAEGITGSGYLFSDKVVSIAYRDIDHLSGGVFSGSYNGVMRVEQGAAGKVIAFFHRIGNAKELEASILTNVREPLYRKVAQHMGWEQALATKETEKK